MRFLMKLMCLHKYRGLCINSTSSYRQTLKSASYQFYRDAKNDVKALLQEGTQVHFMAYSAKYDVSTHSLKLYQVTTDI